MFRRVWCGDADRRWEAGDEWCLSIELHPVNTSTAECANALRASAWVTSAVESFQISMKSRLQLLTN
jgi:hypothetical protein